MSRWLNQVNNLLEKLDGQVETVASATTTTTTSVEDHAAMSVTSPSTPSTTTAVTAAAAAVSVSRAAAVFGSNFVQQATAIATNNAHRLSSLNHNNNENEYTDDDDDDDDDDDEDYEEEDDEEEEEDYDEDEDEVEIYTEDEIDFDDDVGTDGNAATDVVVVPSIMDNVHSMNMVEPSGNDPNDDGFTQNGTNRNVIPEIMEIQNTTTDTINENGSIGGSSSNVHYTVVLPPSSDVPPPVRPPPPQSDMTMTPSTSMNEDTAAERILPTQTIHNLVNDSGSESVPVVVGLETSRVQILEPIKSTASNDRIVMEQLQLQSVNDQHASELAKLIQQNDIALQQVIHQNEMEIIHMKEHNEKERIRLQQQYDYDRKQLQQQNERYKSQVQGLQNELQAVNQELQDAAHIVEQERNATKIERKEILQEQEEELLQMKDEYEEKIQQLRMEIKDLKLQHENQLMESKEEHLQLGDTLEDELQQMTEKYEETQITIDTLQSDKESIQKELQEWKDQYTMMETNFLNVTERLSMAEAAMIAAEERYDIANEQHRKQSQQRLVREAELEQTIAQLLISQQQQQQVSSSINSSKNHSGSENTSDTEEKQHMDTMISNLRGQYQIAMEEMETTKTDLAIAKQQYMALEQEFQDYAKERRQDIESARRMQQEYEKQIQALRQQIEASSKQQDLTSSNSAVNSNVTEHLQRLQHELYEAKERMVSLSDQLLRQQTVVDTQKSEISSLKSRLKVAITRAETAEAQQPVSSMEIEFGRATATAINDTAARSTSTGMNDPMLSKRRVKAGNKYSGSGPPRSIRAALGLQQPSIVLSQRQRGPRLRSSNGGSSMDLQQQIGLTIDAIDGWMIETGHVLRQEPLARLGVAVYFCMIHLFCFTLVAFHTIEVEHGDLGQLTDHSRVIGLRHQLHQG